MDNKFSAGSLIRFNEDYFEDHEEILAFIGLVLPYHENGSNIRILWGHGIIEEYGNILIHYFELIE